MNGQRYELGPIDDGVQCTCCHMWCNKKDIGLVDPGICIFCDCLPNLRSALEELRVEWQGSPGIDIEFYETMQEVSRAITLIVMAMRAGHMSTENKF